MQLQIIQQKIFEIRGQKVMLDFDLAALYEVETKVLNQSVSRNKERFPEDFMFRLTTQEWSNLRSQIVTSSLQGADNQKGDRSQFVTSNYGGTRYLPFAFTEHGITMLSSILKSERAVKMNIAIIRAFIALRKFVLQYSELAEQLKELKDKVGTHDTQLDKIYEAIENLLDEKQERTTWQEKRVRIGFKK